VSSYSVSSYPRSTLGQGEPAPGALILVVDDDPSVRAMLHMALEAEGYRVEMATNGREALARISRQRPSLVLLDLQMPELDGWQVQQQLRAWQIDIPVVFMTAGLRARFEAEQHQAAGYLAKPFDLDTLYETLCRLLNSR
jgi:CheY-like chemotaxis protein